MLNIKNCCFGLPKTYKSILNYDNHNYKKLNDVILDENNQNVELVNNVAIFEKMLNNYKKDIYATYSKERHLKLKKTNKQILEEFNSSKVMRTFRIAINHIELDSLHNLKDDSNKRKENIINFYKNVLETFQKILNENNNFTDKVMIIKADIHFDQTTPHLHIHVSNLYSKNLKKLNRFAITCNCKISDIIRILKQQKEIKLTNSINELFTIFLKNNVKNNNYELINKIDLKKIWPEIYDINQILKINNIDLNNSNKNIGRLDKKVFFLNVIHFLKKINFDPDENNILNCRKLDMATLYLFRQLQFIKMIENDCLANNNQLIFNTFWKKDPNNFVNELIKIKEKYNIFLDKDSLFKNENRFCSFLQNYAPNLKKIEDDFKNKLGLFKIKELDILKKEYFVEQKQKQILSKINNSFYFEKNNLERLENNNIKIHIKEIENEKTELALKNIENAVKINNKLDDAIDLSINNNLNLKLTKTNNIIDDLNNEESFINIIDFIQKNQINNFENNIEFKIQNNENMQKNFENSKCDNLNKMTYDLDFSDEDDYEIIDERQFKKINKTKNSDFFDEINFKKIKEIMYKKT